MIIFEKPKKLITADNFLVVTNIFLTFDYIYIIGVNYASSSDLIKGFRDAFDLKFTLNDIEVNAENIRADAGSADRINIFRISNEADGRDFILKITFEKIEYFYNLYANEVINYNDVKKYCASTIFKDDFELIPSYIHHYRQIGIDDFILYFNGDLEKLNGDEKFRSVVEQLKEINGVKISIVEWNYPYWFAPDGYRLSSIAQLTSIHDLLYKAKYRYEYFLYIDLDEYIFFGEFEFSNLKELAKFYPDIDYFQFNMHWASYINSDSLYDDKIDRHTISYLKFNTNFHLQNFKPQLTIRSVENEVSEVINDSWRSKCFFKPKSIDFFAVHRPVDLVFIIFEGEVTEVKLKLSMKSLDGFFHLINIQEKPRFDYLLKHCIKKIDKESTI